MKSSTPYAIALTLFMLLVVLLAAFYFLFQTRAALEERLNTAESAAEEMRQEQSQLEFDLGDARSTRDAAEAALATVQADNLLLEEDLVESSQVESDLATRMASQGPLIAIVEPREGTTAVNGQTVTIVVAVSDLAGVQSITVNVGEETLEFEGNGQTTVVARREWQANFEGELTLSVTAVNVNGIPGETVTQALTVLEPTLVPTNTPVPPTPTPEPAAEPASEG